LIAFKICGVEETTVTILFKLRRLALLSRSSPDFELEFLLLDYFRIIIKNNLDSLQEISATSVPV
jgi:hypothetical protein